MGLIILKKRSVQGRVFLLLPSVILVVNIANFGKKIPIKKSEIIYFQGDKKKPRRIFVSERVTLSLERLEIPSIPNFWESSAS